MKGNRTIYWIVAGVMAVLLVVMLITWRSNRADQEAMTKANQLISAFEGAGLTPPKDPARGAKVPGTDGGPVCGSVGSGVGRGIAKLNLMVGGAAGPRPVIDQRS